MHYKIAVLTTEFVKRHMERCLSKLELDCSFQICCYHPFDDIEVEYVVRTKEKLWLFRYNVELAKKESETYIIKMCIRERR